MKVLVRPSLRYSIFVQTADILSLVTSHGPISQSDFLLRMGIQMRVEALKRAAKTDDREVEIDKAVDRLLDVSGMGSEYQVLGVTSHGEQAVEDVWPFIDLDIEHNAT